MIHAFHPARLNVSRSPFRTARNLNSVADNSSLSQRGRSHRSHDVEARLNRLKQKASLLLSVEHNFHGTIEGPSGDTVEISSEFSFSMEFSHEMRLLEHRNRRELKKRAMKDFENNGQDPEALEGFPPGQTKQAGEVQDLDEIVPEFATSEATSDRIVGFSTGLLPFFIAAKEGRGMDEETLNDFMELIRGSIDTGFEQGRSIIKDMELMNDPLGNLIQKTYDKVQEKLDLFFENTLAEINGEDTDDESSEATEETSSPARVTRFSTDYNFELEAASTTEVQFDRKG